jgi:hypothetical protein
MRKIDVEGGGFKPAEFKSSRSSRFKQAEEKSEPVSQDTLHDNVIFGPADSRKFLASKNDIQKSVNILTSHLDVNASKPATLVNNTVLGDAVNLILLQWWTFYVFLTI